jgi:hypothetical protein
MQDRNLAARRGFSFRAARVAPNSRAFRPYSNLNRDNCCQFCGGQGQLCPENRLGFLGIRFRKGFPTLGKFN